MVYGVVVVHNTNDYSKMKINGRAIWVCENLIDYD